MAAVNGRGLVSMLLLVIILAGISSEFARGQNTGWNCLLQDSTPEANANTLRAITFAFNRFVAVGDFGTVTVSTNGMQWYRQPTPTQSSLHGVTSDQDGFVAVGDAGCVLRSTNGYDWSLAVPGVTNNLRAIAFGNGVFVVVTEQSGMLVSSDALSWKPCAAGNFPNGVYFGGGLFVAYGINGLILTSSDGFNWTKATPPALSFFSCGAYGAGIFVAAGHEDFRTGQVARSSDGVVWTSVTFTTPNGLWSGVCYGGGRFVGIDSGWIVCSTDG